MNTRLSRVMLVLGSVLIVGLFVVLGVLIFLRVAPWGTSENVLDSGMDSSSRNVFSHAAYPFSFRVPEDFSASTNDIRFVKVCENNHTDGFCFTVTRHEVGVTEFLSLTPYKELLSDTKRTFDQKSFVVKEVSFAEGTGATQYQTNYRLQSGTYVYDITSAGEKSRVLDSSYEAVLNGVAQSLDIDRNFPETVLYADAQKRFQISYPSGWSVQDTHANAQYSDADILFGSPTWHGEPDWQIHVYSTQATSASLIADARSAAAKIGSTVAESSVTVAGTPAKLLTVLNKEKTARAYEVIFKKDAATYLLSGSDYYSKKFQDFYASIKF